jgi:hypothetical protein
MIEGKSSGTAVVTAALSPAAALVRWLLSVLLSASLPLVALLLVAVAAAEAQARDSACSSALCINFKNFTCYNTVMHSKHGAGMHKLISERCSA